MHMPPPYNRSRVERQMRVLYQVLVIVAFGLATVQAVPAHATTPPQTNTDEIEKAFKAVTANAWTMALKHAHQSNDPLAVKIIEWLRYQEPGTQRSFEPIARFVEANPNWPRMSRVRRSAEAAIDAGDDAARVARWFNKHPPLSGAGALAHLAALTRLDETDKIQTLATRYWRTLNFTRDEDRKFHRKYKKHLSRNDHIVRLDRLIWDQKYWPARHMLPRVDAPQAALGRARLALMRREGGVDNAIARVPEDLKNAASLQYERLRWRRRKGRDESASELLLAAPNLTANQERWAVERVILARRALTDGHYSEARRLVAGHGLTSGAEFADAEFLAGWIALTFLDEPEAALEHFTRLHDGVQFPISRARGAFWAGRAAMAANDQQNAKRWWRIASQFPATFYGQQAIAALGKTEVSIPFTAAPDPQAAMENFQPELVRATRILHDHGPKRMIRTFLRQLSELSSTVEEQFAVVHLANEVSHPDEAVRAAKRVAQLNNVVPTPAYPSLPFENTKGVTAKQQRDLPLVLALIRQESAFNPRAVSSAGARGMMQLLPSTAKRMARTLGKPYNRARLLDDPRYNVQLGSAHLDRLVSRFDESPALALAAYNAGPTRVVRWLRQIGDPRTGEIDLVDWIESIPFAETRNYVQRVLESETVYRVLIMSDQLASSTPGSPILTGIGGKQR